MRRLLWAFGWVGVAVWSLFCALAYGLFDLIGRGFMRTSGAWSNSPETVEGIFKFFSFLHSFSTGAVLVIWAIVSLAILAVPWVFDRLIGATPRGFAQPMPGHAPTSRFDRSGGVIDLEPGQYSVGPRGEAAPGVPPRIPPRT